MSDFNKAAIAKAFDVPESLLATPNILYVITAWTIARNPEGDELKVQRERSVTDLEIVSAVTGFDILDMNKRRAREELEQLIAFLNYTAVDPISIDVQHRVLPTEES